MGDELKPKRIEKWLNKSLVIPISMTLRKRENHFRSKSTFLDKTEPLEMNGYDDVEFFLLNELLARADQKVSKVQ